MSYHFSMQSKKSWAEIEEKLTETLKEEGFGILTLIDMKETLKKKLDVDLPPYKIFGACNPKFAYESLKQEPRIGLMLPCNVIVRELEGGIKEISAIDPVASMTAIENHNLTAVAATVQGKLKNVIHKLEGIL